MYKVKVYVTLRESVLDPQGTAVMHSLHAMNYNEVSDVRIGKGVGAAIGLANLVTFFAKVQKVVGPFKKRNSVGLSGVDGLTNT